MADTRRYQVVGHGRQLRLARREPDDPGARQEPYEGFRVLGGAPPGESRQDQFATGEVPAGITQIRCHHAADRAVQLVVAAEQPQAQRVGFQQCAQPHLVAADPYRPPLRYSRSAELVVSRGKQRGN